MGYPQVQKPFCVPRFSFVVLTEKKMHNLKVENWVSFGGFAEDLSLGGSLSCSSETLLQRGEGRARIYRNFCNKNQVVRTARDYC